jgi:hypothetical protein
MINIIFGLLVLSSASAIAVVTKQVYTNKESIITILNTLDVLRNDIVAKSLVESKSLTIDKIVTTESGGLWNATGSNCELAIGAYSRGSIVSEKKFAYGDEGCPQF